MNNSVTRSFAIVALFTTLGLVGCKGKIDGEKVEGAIRSGMLEKLKVEMKSLSCPKDLEAKAGGEFECTGEAKDGDKLVFAINQTDDQGNINWKLKSANGEAVGAGSASPSASASH